MVTKATLLSLLVLGLLLGGPAAAGDPVGPGAIAVTVKGLACPFCVYGLEKHLHGLSGVRSVSVDVAKGHAVIETEPAAVVTDEQIRTAVRQAGFTAGAIERGRLPEPDP